MGRHRAVKDARREKAPRAALRAGFDRAIKLRPRCKGRFGGWLVPCRDLAEAVHVLV